jgi:hypothetical protein
MLSFENVLLQARLFAPTTFGGSRRMDTDGGDGPIPFATALEALESACDVFAGKKLQTSNLWGHAFDFLFRKEFSEMENTVMSVYRNEGMLRSYGLSVSKAVRRCRAVDTAVRKFRSLALGLPDRATVRAAYEGHSDYGTAANTAALAWLYPNSRKALSKARSEVRKRHPHMLKDVITSFGATFRFIKSHDPPAAATATAPAPSSAPPPPAPPAVPFFTTMAAAGEKENELAVFNPSATESARVRFKALPYFIREGEQTLTAASFSGKGLQFHVPPRSFAIFTGAKARGERGGNGGTHVSVCVTIFGLKPDDAAAPAAAAAPDPAAAASAAAPAAAAPAPALLPSVFAQNLPVFAELTPHYYTMPDDSAVPPGQPRLMEESKTGWRLLKDSDVRCGSLLGVGLEVGERTLIGVDELTQPEMDVIRKTHKDGSPRPHPERFKFRNAEIMVKDLLTAEQAAAHKAAWPEGQPTFLACDPGEN